MLACGQQPRRKSEWGWGYQPERQLQYRREPQGRVPRRTLWPSKEDVDTSRPGCHWGHEDGGGGMHFRPRGVRIRPQELGPQNEGSEAEGPTAHTVLQAQNWPANKSQWQLSGLCSQRPPCWDVRLSRPSQHNVLSCILTLSCISPWIFFTLCSLFAMSWASLSALGGLLHSCFCRRNFFTLSALLSTAAKWNSETEENKACLESDVIKTIQPSRQPLLPLTYGCWDWIPIATSFILNTGCSGSQTHH